MAAYSELCIGFSTHRPEVLEATRMHMEKYPVIVLEEPETPEFARMLRGEIPIDEYLLQGDFEFPEFARRSCVLYQSLYAQGKTFLQVDPYMDILLHIHEKFASGKSPGDIEKGSLEEEVYRAEHEWTKALYAYYGFSLSREFDRVVLALQNFAGSDAARGRLRDRLRSKRLAELVSRHPFMYVEAGYIHQGLLVQLMRICPAGCSIRPVYPLKEASLRLTGFRQVLGPGDRLTLHYTFHQAFAGQRADLLAARSLVYIKILSKEEILDSSTAYPHLLDEALCLKLVNRLSYEDCRRLYPAIKGMDTKKARARVESYTAGTRA